MKRTLAENILNSFENEPDNWGMSSIFISCEDRVYIENTKIKLVILMVKGDGDYYAMTPVNDMESPSTISKMFISLFCENSSMF